MGYTTQFEGTFRLDRPLRPEEARYLTQFAQTRRMKRDAVKAAVLPDPVREALNLHVGQEGCYFVGGLGFAGQDEDESVVDAGRPPKGQPGLWCQWVPTEDGQGIEWDGGEKFYDYVQWLDYLIEHFLKPWGYTLSGEVRWQGEDDEDTGTIHMTNNEVTVDGHPYA